MGLRNDQLEKIQALDEAYLQHVTQLCIDREASLTALQAATPNTVLAPLSSPLRAGEITNHMARCAVSFDLQQEAYLNLVRTFVLAILTPYQAGLLCAAAYPFFMEFPAIIAHVLEAASSPGARR